MIIGDAQLGMVTSVRIDQADFAARPGYAFEYRGSGKPVLRALARGKRLQVFAEAENEPVADLLIGDGQSAAATR
jgi:hypothetical protein